MTHNSDNLWLSISVVWAALLHRSAVTWFAVLCYFELMKKGPSMGKNRWGRFFCLPSQTSGLACQALLLIAAPRGEIKLAGHLPQPCREARCRHHWQRGCWLSRPVVMPAVDAAPPAAIKRRADEVGQQAVAESRYVLATDAKS
jgi:hypothetical protein